MKIKIEFNFDTNNLKFYRIRHRRLFGTYITGDGVYTAIREFNKRGDEKDEKKVIEDAVLYLTNLLCHIEVLPKHYHLIRQFYNMFNSMICFLRELEPGDHEYEFCFCGEYSGTYGKVSVWCE